MKANVCVLLQEADDDFRNLFDKIISSDERFLLLRSYKSIQQLSDEIHLHNPHFILINWHNPPDQLIHFIKLTSERCPDADVIVTFDFIQPDFIYKIMACGAAGILQKPFTAASMLQASHFISQHAKLNLHLQQLHNISELS